jgi:t-SNARE complex subunit (syntaxin)
MLRQCNKQNNNHVDFIIIRTKEWPAVTSVDTACIKYGRENREHVLIIFLVIIMMLIIVLGIVWKSKSPSEFSMIGGKFKLIFSSFPGIPEGI